MKRNIGVTAVLGLFAAVLLTASANATCTSPSLISFNGVDVFAYESSYNNATYLSANGSVLTIMGKVVCFAPPLDYLNANMPAKEYTFAIENLVSSGTIPSSPFPGTNVWDTDYNTAGGAVWSLWEDPTPDAPGTATVTCPPGALLPLFKNDNDAVLLLNGTIDGNFHTQITQTVATNRWSGSFNGLYHSTGGSKYGQVGNGQANINGLWCSLGTGISQCSLPSCYSAHPSGKFDTPGTTASLGSTWGRIKMLYR